ncbi:unnamed protein product [Amoebophrya sp. A120]|nr:unnamed protein product [Amoebophrya sp. A120]|eukprot:GSA120T00012116001.1
MKQKTNRPQELTLDPVFEKYYRANWGDEIFDAFWEASKTALPCVVRLRESAKRNHLRDQLLKYGWEPLESTKTAKNNSSSSADIEAFSLPAAVYSLPDSTDERSKNSNKHRILCEDENRRGFLQFGEIASMLPVIALQPEKNDKILDLCAAPGNKTLALSDAVGQDGLVWANDYDIERTCWTLTRHSGKARSRGLVVTCWDGATLGKKILGGGGKSSTCSTSSAAATVVSDGNREGLDRLDVAVDAQDDNIKRSPLLFDKVLCDVPCSADGTLRKYRDTVLDFQKKLHYAVCQLHPLQLDLLESAFQMTKVGGLIAYSTCSLNPVENEAVVRAFLEAHGEEVELVPIFDEMNENGNCDGRGFDQDDCGNAALFGRKLRATQGFKCMPGLTRWEDVEPFLETTAGTVAASATSSADVEKVVLLEDEMKEHAFDEAAQQSEPVKKPATTSAASTSPPHLAATPNTTASSPEVSPVAATTAAKTTSRKPVVDEKAKAAKKQKKAPILPSTVHPPKFPDERLRNCARVMPNLEPVAGGFFLAVFRKKAGKVFCGKRAAAAAAATKHDQDGDVVMQVSASSSSTSTTTNCSPPSPDHEKQLQFRQAGYFKRLREKAKWRRELSSKWARFFTSKYDEGLLLGFDEEVGGEEGDSEKTKTIGGKKIKEKRASGEETKEQVARSAADSAEKTEASLEEKGQQDAAASEIAQAGKPQTSGATDATRQVQDPVKPEGATTTLERDQSNLPSHVTPWEFYGLESLKEALTTKESATSLFFHTSRGHSKPRKVCIASSFLGEFVSSVLDTEEQERDDLKRKRVEEQEKDKAQETMKSEQPGSSSSSAEPRVKKSDSAAEPSDLPKAEDQSQVDMSTSSTEKQPEHREAIKHQKKPPPVKKQFQDAVDPEIGFALPFVQLGLALFKRERNEKYMRHLKCRYRPTQKCVDLLLKHQTKRRLTVCADEDFTAFLNRDLKQGLPIKELLEWSESGRITGVANLNDEVGAALLCNGDGSVGVCVFITSQRMIVQAEEEDVEWAVWKLGRE